MKKAPVLIIVFLLFIADLFACTTFFINKDGQMVFGRNYDWLTGNGMVCTNLRGLFKTSDKTGDGETISWTSKYGSITFNQYGKEFPTGGMNEKGLVVELMWLDGTKYPDADDRPAVGVLQWIQYQLDNCSTVDELIATDKTVRIASKGTTPLHYLVADATGNAATIEFLDGKMKVHKGADLPFPVLTNDIYSSSIEQTTIATSSSGGNEISFSNNSIDRFAKACNMVKAFQKENSSTPVIDYSFSILDKVAQGSHTKWSIVYDISNKKVYFKTLGYSSVKNIAFSSFDLACPAVSKTYDMNQAGEGNIAASFIDFTIEINSKLVTRSFDDSKTEFTVSEESRKKHWEYPGSVTCQKASD
ncbi:MAG: linear amide C-N hydrolase [Chitinophagaceae bacterium]|nr:linear amide C-N hydrolase [Chitinophagaceae bacterium]